MCPVNIAVSQTLNYSVMWIITTCILQYKGAHVKPGFAEHFYSNPARYKGRDNMFVSEQFMFVLHSSPFNILLIYTICGVVSSTMTPLRMRWEEVRNLTLMGWYLSTLGFTQMNGSTSSRLSPWLELVCVWSHDFSFVVPLFSLISN